MASGKIVLSVAALLVLGALGKHPKCEDMATYQAPYVSKTYNRTRHLGHYYELAFRDLYLPSPTCDCQHTYKIADEGGSYHEDFEQECKMLGRMASVLAMNATESTSIFRQSFAWSNPNPPIPGIKKVGFNTGVIAYKEVPGQDQYEWVIEFTCDQNDPIPLRMLFGGDTFVGINMYSRSGPTNAKNLDEMIAAAKDLGLGWVMNNTWGWGFHIVPHTGVGNAPCAYNPPTTQEYACVKGTCTPVRWGAGTTKESCTAKCQHTEAVVV